MKCISCRRLTGPNLLWDRPGAVVDVTFGDIDVEIGTSTWVQYARLMMDGIGWSQEQTCTRQLSDGSSLALSAPIDALYTAASVAEWAWQATTVKLLQQSEPPDMAASVKTISEQLAKESNPKLLDLAATAKQNECTLLADPDIVSIGLGDSCEQWPTNSLPEPVAVNWPHYKDIPIALITGTNGKTTSARLTNAIAKAAGFRPGMSSTDGVVVDDVLVEKGDYSGPGGARAVLRNPDTQFAVLETARGGLLRRGLGVTQADAALVTNIASDHIGQFGVSNLEELADVKWIVSRAIQHDGTLVVNADDPLLVSRGLNSDLDIVWFSPDADNPVLVQSLAQNGTVCTVIDDHIATISGDQSPQLLMPLVDIPITYQGKALFNIANVLGVVGLTSAMGVPRQAMIKGLAGFNDSANPGRTNFFKINGATVLVDFAHNTHGLEALLQFAMQLQSKRRLLLVGHAGDRTDEDIRDLARCTEHIALDRIIIKTLDRLRRGRKRGEIEALMRDQYLAQGVAESVLQSSDDEMSGIQAALEWALPGDLLILLAHDDKQGVLKYLKKLDDNSES